MEHDEKKANEEQQTEERDEMDDLDVSQQKAEDVKGGRPRASGRGRESRLEFLDDAGMTGLVMPAEWEPHERCIMAWVGADLVSSG